LISRGADRSIRPALILDTDMASEIRQIRATDAEEFRAAVDVVARERKYLYLLAAPTLDEVRQFVGRNIEKGVPHLVLSDGDLVAGWCTIIAPAREIQSHVGGLAMGLRPEWRDRGWGTKLLRETLAAADTFGYRRVELTVYAGNTHAAALYRKLGFVEEGVKRQSVCIDGAYLDEILMARLRS